MKEITCICGDTFIPNNSRNIRCPNCSGNNDRVRKIKLKTSKRCTKCQKLKPLTEFDDELKNKDKKVYWCKTCRKEYRRQRYIKTNI